MSQRHLSFLHIPRPPSRPARLAQALWLAGLFSQLAVAQSTGTLSAEGVEELVVTGRGVLNLGGMTAQTAAKSRVSVTGEDLLKASAGQTFLDALNQVPGLNFTNSDAYGSSGGNIRLRGFDGARVSLTFDGIPLNDTGNYASYTNQMIDAELIQQVDVNQGTTDVDSPTASAIGGTINNRTRTPQEMAGGRVSLTTGEDSYNRLFVMGETGSIGPWNTRAWVAGSVAKNDKFKGPGEIYKRQFNAKVYQALDNGNFISAAVHYNRNRNNFYRNTTVANWDLFGRSYDNLATCTRVAARAGVRDDENATLVASIPSLPSGDNTANPSSCTNYYGLRINPSDTGNIRFNSLWNLRDNLRLTVDPSYQYVLANGGGTTVVNESPGTASDRRVVGTTALTGFDLNGDSDILDSVRFYTPNTTNTNRLGLNASLIWDISETQTLRFAYAYDYGKHRQTGEFGYLDANGNPENVFGGREGRPIATADGSILRSRDRFSIAELNQYSIEYRWSVNEALKTEIGLRIPRFRRELNQYCFTQNGSANVLCTTQAPTTTLPTGNVRFGSTEYLKPFSATVEFDDVLPNVGVTYELNDTNTVYASYAGGLSAPRTDNLYGARLLADGTLARTNPVPETTDSFDLGWRLNTGDLLASVVWWNTSYTDRIVSAFDEELGFSVDRNVGDVDLSGLDGQFGFRLADWATMSLMASYNDSALQSDLRISATTTVPTRGKQIVETPEWSYGLRLDTSFAGFDVGLEGKYVDERYTTDLNDASVPDYVLFHLNASYQFELDGVGDLRWQLNVYNLFDEQFFANISSTVGAVALPGFSPSTPNVSLGAPRTVSTSLQLVF